MKNENTEHEVSAFCDLCDCQAKAEREQFCPECSGSKRKAFVTGNYESLSIQLKTKRTINNEKYSTKKQRIPEIRNGQNGAAHQSLAKTL